MKILHYTTQLGETYNNLLQGILTLTQGKLSELIIPYDIPYLADSINRIAKAIQSYDFKLYSTDPLLYYQQAYFHVVKNNGTLYITIPIPIVKPEMTLNLYKIITYLYLSKILHCMRQNHKTCPLIKPLQKRLIFT